MSSALIAALIIMLASLSGAIFVWKSADSLVMRNSRYLVTFSAGVFIIVSYGLFTESIELGGRFLLILTTAIAGALFLEIVGRIMSTTHHHHGTDHGHSHDHLDAKKVLLGDALHNIVDGLLLVPAFLIDVRVGIATTLAIFLHEIVQEISEFFIMKEAGYSTTKALILNFLVSSTILIGVYLGFYIAVSDTAIAALTAFAAGAFMYVVFRDLLPSTMRDIVRKRDAKKHLIAGVLGLIVMFSVGALLPHHEDSTHEQAQTTPSLI